MADAGPKLRRVAAFWKSKGGEQFRLVEMTAGPDVLQHLVDTKWVPERKSYIHGVLCDCIKRAHDENGKLGEELFTTKGALDMIVKKEQVIAHVHYDDLKAELDRMREQRDDALRKHKDFEAEIEKLKTGESE